MKNENEMNSNATIEEVVEKINDYMSQNNLSRAAMAAHFNWNRSTLSQFLRGKYTGNNDALRLKAIEFFNMNIELPETDEEHFVETVQAKTVFSVCRFAQRKGFLALLIGPAGAGKTTALEAYVRKNSQAVMITAYSRIPPNSFFKRIASKLRYETGGDYATIIDMLILRLKGKNILLIIDEGHYVKLEILEKLRHIQDMTGVGVVLSGNFATYEQMKGKDAIKFAHLTSRSVMKVRIDGAPVRSELREIMEKRGMPTDRSSMDFMTQKALLPGNFRNMRNIVELATEIADMENTAVAFQHLLEAEKMTMITED